MVLIRRRTLQQISYDPGMEGFIKAHRHPTGAALVMTTWTEADEDCIGIHWVKRLSHNARAVVTDKFRVVNEMSIKAAERCYVFQLAHGPPPEAMVDVQRQRVYDWEDWHILPGHETPMDWHGCQFFLDYVWQRVGKGPIPELTNDRRFAVAISLGGTVHLPLDTAYWIKPVILHEVAHELKPRVAHGPAFVKLYMDLAVRFLGCDREKLERSAIHFGIDFA